MKKKKKWSRNRHGFFVLSSDTDIGSLFTDDQEKQGFAELLDRSGDTQFAFCPWDTREPSAPGRYVPRADRVANLDLHGRNVEEAVLAVDSFLLTHQRLRSLWVRIITGRGLHSAGGRPVLKQVVEEHLRVLRQEKKISDYKWEGKNREESGALLVMLKRQRF